MPIHLVDFLIFHRISKTCQRPLENQTKVIWIHPLGTKTSIIWHCTTNLKKRFQSNQSTQNVSFFQFISLIFYFLFWQVGLIKSWYQVSLAASSFSSHCINTATTRITEKGLIVMIMSQDLNCLLSLLPPLQKVIWMPVSIWVCNISESVLVWHVCVSCVILQ